MRRDHVSSTCQIEQHILFRGRSTGEIGEANRICSWRLYLVPYCIWCSCCVFLCLVGVGRSLEWLTIAWCPLISWSMLLGTPNRFFKCDFHVGFYHNYKELFILIANFIYVVWLEKKLCFLNIGYFPAFYILGLNWWNCILGQITDKNSIDFTFISVITIKYIQSHLAIMR